MFARDDVDILEWRDFPWPYDSCPVQRIASKTPSTELATESHDFDAETCSPAYTSEFHAAPTATDPNAVAEANA